MTATKGETGWKARIVAFCAGLTLIALALLPAQPAKAQISTIRDAEIEKLMREYSDPIFRAAGLTPSSIKIYLVNSPVVNAFVAGGQNMFLHTGLIVQAETPNELIGVIAHETGHIAGGHLARIGGAARAATTPLIISLALGALAIAAGAPDAGAAILAGGTHVAQRQVLAYSRTQEAAADQAAVTYLENAGQNPQGILDFFDYFRDSQVMIGQNIDPYAVTHPLAADRISALENRIARSPYRDVQDSPQDLHRFNMAKAKLYGFLDKTAIVFRRYPETDQSLPAHYARAVAYYRDAQIDEALAELEPIFEAEPKNPYIHELKSQILFESGRVADAIAPARKALELDPDEPLLRLALGQALLASDDAGTDKSVTAEAKTNLEAAIRVDRTNPSTWRQLAVAYARLDQPALAALATAERHYITGNAAGAREFAARAQQGLPAGSADWQRANDILATVPQPQRGGRRSRFTFETDRGQPIRTR